MKFRHFNEFEEFEESIRHAQVELTLPKLELPFWSLCRFDAGNLNIQIGREGCADIAIGAACEDGVVLYLQLTGEWGLANGEPLMSDRLIAMGPGTEFCIRAEAAHDWVSVYIPSNVLTAENVRHLGRGETQIIESPLVHKLHRTFQRLLQFPEEQFEAFSEPAAVQVFEADLQRYCCRILGQNASIHQRQTGRPSRPRMEIISHAVALMDGVSGQPPTIREIAANTGISERLLHTVFLKYFGVSPSRFLQFRRLHQAHRLLRLGPETGLTVAQIAGRVGMWDFGRFATRYRRLFNELPSETLKKRTSGVLR